MQNTLLKISKKFVVLVTKMIKLKRSKRVFNEQTGFLKVHKINGGEFVEINSKFYKLEKKGRKYKIYDFFINLAGELTFEEITSK